jgi:signal transduction histidine kinase/CheY-like chemotaxis protein
VTPARRRSAVRRRVTSDVALLGEATRTLGGTLDVDRVAARLTELAQAVLGADAAGTWLIERGSDELILKSGSGFTQSEPIARIPHASGRDVLGWITDRSGPVVLRTLPGSARPAMRRWLEAEKMRSFLGVPLVGEAMPVGVLGLFRRSGRSFTRTDLGRARTLCVPAAPAIVNARLYTDQLARAERTAVLLAIAESAGATLDLPAALKDISQRAARALDAERCTISVWPEGGVPAEASIGEAQATRSKRPVELDGGLLVVPIVRKGDVIGAMTLVARPRHRWERSSVDLAVAIAGEIALVAENVRLYRDVQTKAERLVQGETLRALGELAGGAAHHLNNLLTIVVGRTQLLHRTVKDERVQRPLATIERAAKDGAEVVRRLQQFAGMRRTAQSRPVDLNEIVTEVIELTRDRWQDAARAAGLEIIVEPRLGGLPMLDGDEPALRELLTNLVMNAVDAMPAGGRITIETRQERGHALLSVTDTGSGMSDEVRLRAHEPFFTTKGVKSTGLGLSVSYGIARQHGGEVTIRSQEGRGTTIVVQLPLPAVGEAEPPPPPVPTRRPLRILLVDDEPDVRLALAEMLASEMHTVTPASSGDEALRRLDSDGSIELVLTDLVMPVMNGWEIAAAVKARRPALPVGVITGWGDLPETVAGPRASVDFVIAKPINLDELADAVARLGAS